MSQSTSASSPNEYGRGMMYLEGGAALVMGVLAILAPDGGGLFLAKLLGLYWLLRAGMDLVRLVMDRTWWVWRLFGALIGLTAGIVMLQHPMVSTQLDDQRTIMAIGILGVLYGMLCLIQASLSKGWGLAVLGILSGILGLILLSEPYIGDVQLATIVGVFAVIGGLSTFYAAAKME